MNDPDRPVPSEAPARIVSLDQFRGYTVAGMLLVNFLSGYAAVPAVLKHHNTYCSYADTIMPQFFFAVGFAFRLTFLKRAAAVGAWAASRATVRRCLGLALLGLAMYHLDGNVKTWEQLRSLGVWGFLTTAFRRGRFRRWCTSPWPRSGCCR
ncbi:MAG: heparan-alpha-glucosaminide N-acetyltransferase domain-containing protein [Isosphaeraceae bacterium]